MTWPIWATPGREQRRECAQHRELGCVDCWPPFDIEDLPDGDLGRLADMAEDRELRRFGWRQSA